MSPFYLFHKEFKHQNKPTLLIKGLDNILFVTFHPLKGIKEQGCVYKTSNLAIFSLLNIQWSCDLVDMLAFFFGTKAEQLCAYIIQTDVLCVYNLSQKPIFSW